MVNILISTYNGEKYIEEQLDSILSQSYQDFLIYIRDDGSTDQTGEVIKQYIAHNGIENICIFVQGENVGFCKSFFQLMAMSSKGDYWAFCDQDDYWYPDKLLHAVKWLSQNEKEKIPLLYHSGFELGNADMTVKRMYHQGYFDYQFFNSITSNLFFGFSTTINRALYEKLILADPHMIKYHDWFAAMITAAFGKYHLSKKIEAVHRQHQYNSSPLFFVKKIPHGIRLLKGDLFYKNNAKEFMRLFGEDLQEKDREILSWFLNDHYSLGIACRKAFYPRRWNPHIGVEIVLRFLMLVGRV